MGEQNAHAVVWAVWQDASLTLPAESGNYLVWVHSPLRGIMSHISDDYAAEAFFDRGGCLWCTVDDTEHYNACLTAVDRDTSYHVSHWMPMPTGPEGIA